MRILQGRGRRAHPPVARRAIRDRARYRPGTTGTWHYGLIARWWAEVNQPDEAELACLRAAIARFGEPTLDLGCGTGRLLVPLLAEGLDVDGTDISPDMLGYVRDAAEVAGIDVEGRLAAQPFDGLDRPRRTGRSSPSAPLRSVAIPGGTRPRCAGSTTTCFPGERCC